MMNKETKIFNNIADGKLETKSISFVNGTAKLIPKTILLDKFNGVNVLKYKRCFNNVLKFELANMRSAFPKRKNISTKSGSGRKVRPQKGTGRARLGSSRANQLRGGASCFGEQITLHYKKINKKEFNNSMFFLLKHKSIYIIDFILEKYKTAKLFNIFVQKLNLKKMLLVFSFEDLEKNEILIRSFCNLKGSSIIYLFDINLFSFYTFDNILFLSDAKNKFFSSLNKLSLHSSLRKHRHKHLAKYIF